jgi:hypothetical protein
MEMAENVRAFKLPDAARSRPAWSKPDSVYASRPAVVYKPFTVQLKLDGQVVSKVVYADKQITVWDWPHVSTDLPFFAISWSGLSVSSSSAVSDWPGHFMYAAELACQLLDAPSVVGDKDVSSWTASLLKAVVAKLEPESQPSASASLVSSDPLFSMFSIPDLSILGVMSSAADPSKPRSRSSSLDFCWPFPDTLTDEFCVLPTADGASMQHPFNPDASTFASLFTQPAPAAAQPHIEEFNEWLVSNWSVVGTYLSSPAAVDLFDLLAGAPKRQTPVMSSSVTPASLCDYVVRINMSKDALRAFMMACDAMITAGAKKVSDIARDKRTAAMKRVGSDGSDSSTPRVKRKYTRRAPVVHVPLGALKQ